MSQGIIIKYLFMNEFRKEYFTLSQSISEFFGYKINYIFVYIISILISLFNAFIVSLVFTTLSEYIHYKYFFWGSLIFSILLSFFQGNNYATKILKPEINDAFLYSKLPDQTIHYIYLVKGIISFFVDSLQVFFIVFYLTIYFRTNIFNAILNIGFIIFISVFLFISGVYVKKEKEVNNAFNNFIIEFKYIINYIILCIFVYIISILSIEMIFRLKNMSNYTIEEIRFIFFDNLNYHFPHLVKFISNLENIFTNLFVNETKGILYLFVFSLLFYGINYYLKKPFVYRGKLIKTKTNFKEKIFLSYIDGIAKKIIDKGEKFPFTKKDFILIKRNYKLFSNIPLINLLIPFPFIMRLIILYVFYIYFKELAIYLLFYAIATGLLDCHSLIRDIFIFILPNSEVKNILLLKESNYSYKNMLKNKVKLLQRLSIVPFIFILLTSNIVAIYLGIYSIMLNLSIIAWSFIMFYFSSWLHIYGDIYNIDFYFNSYKELQEKSMLKKFYSNFYKVPRRILDFIYAFIIYTVFLDFKIDLIFITGNLIYILFLGYIVSRTVYRGEKSFYEKNIL